MCLVCSLPNFSQEGGHGMSLGSGKHFWDGLRGWNAVDYHLPEMFEIRSALCFRTLAYNQMSWRWDPSPDRKYIYIFTYTTEGHLTCLFSGFISLLFYNFKMHYFVIAHIFIMQVISKPPISSTTSSQTWTPHPFPTSHLLIPTLPITHWIQQVLSVCTGVTLGSSTGAWTTYKDSHPWRKLTLAPRAAINCLQFLS